MLGMSRASRPAIRTWNAARLLRAACLLMVGLAAPAPAAATTYFWIGPSGGDWNNAANWNPSTGFPNSPDDIAIVNGGTSALEIAIPNNVRPVLRQLRVSGSGLISIVGPTTALSLAPLAGQPAIDYTGTGGLVINTSIALGRPFAIVRAATAASDDHVPTADHRNGRAARHQEAGPRCRPLQLREFLHGSDERRTGSSGLDARPARSPTRRAWRCERARSCTRSKTK